MDSLQTANREYAAGAAQWLWARFGEACKTCLMTRSLGDICYLQGVNQIDRPLTYMQYRALIAGRRRTADAALALWGSRYRVSQEWLACAAPGYIRQCARRHAMDVRAVHPGYRENHGGRVIAAPGSCSPERATQVADSAQWLWLNREAASVAWLMSRDADQIERACGMARKYSERLEEKKYSLSDLRRAYDMGHHHGVTNGVHCYTNQMRDGALKEI